MKAMGIMILKKEIPEFQSEAAEAAWWDSHRDQTDVWMREAIANRQTTTLSAVLAKVRHSAASHEPFLLGFDPSDLERARTLALKKGVQYETLLRELLHEAIEREEQKIAS